MQTSRVDMIVNRGEDWSVQLILTDQFDEPLKLATPFRMDVKDAAGQPVISLTSSDQAPDFQTEIPEITVSEDVGVIQLHIDDSVTRNLNIGQHSYDLFGHVTDDDIYAGDQVVKFCEGRFVVNKSITEAF